MSLNDLLNWLFNLLGLLRNVQVTSHQGHLPHQGVNCYFITVRNRSPFRKAVITEVWFDVGIRLPVLNAERPLPKVLPAEEIWETWMPLQALPLAYQANAETRARVKLSDGKVISAKVNPDVSPAGHVPA